MFLQIQPKISAFTLSRENVIFTKMIPRIKFGCGTVHQELLILIFQFSTNYIKDFTEGSPMNPCWVKLRMSIKTIQLICKALEMTSFCMIRVSAERYFRIHCYCKVKILSFIYHTYQAGNFKFKVNSKHPSIMRGICSKLTRKTLEQH